jgi:hypothetical protein
MATSTNYLWTEPNDSDLVTNGALAIRTLGDAIDTSLWNSGYGQAGKNKLINGSMQVAQRGTASTAIGSGTFLADRWQSARTGFAAGASQSRQNTNDTTNLPFIQYCLRVQRDSGNTSTAVIITGQNIESVNSIPLAGQTITVSFYARAGANFSAASSILVSQISTGTGTDQNLVTSGTLTGISSTITNHTLTTTWKRFSVTRSVATTATQVCLEFYYTPVGTASTNDYYEVTGVQVEAGSTATPFQTASGGSIQGELAMCQRYYYRRGNTAANEMIGIGSSATADYSYVNIFHPVTMRSAPTFAVSAAGDFFVANGTVAATASNIVTDTSSVNANAIAVIKSGLTVGTASRVYRNGSASGAFMEFTAEL